jgi:hypothetical protein
MLIRKIDGILVKDNQELLAMIASRKPGETVRLDILRAGEPLKIDVKLANRQSDSSGRRGEPAPEDDQSVPNSGEGLGITVQAIRQDGVDDGAFEPLELSAVNLEADNIRNIHSRERDYPSAVHLDAEGATPRERPVARRARGEAPSAGVLLAGSCSRAARTPWSRGPHCPAQPDRFQAR